MDLIDSDKTRLKGFVEIYYIDKENKKQLINKSNNLIVYTGREWVLPRISGIDNPYISSLASYKLSWLSVGNGGCPITNPLDPIPPSSTDIGLNNQIVLNANDTTLANNGMMHPFSDVQYLQDNQNNNMYLIMRIDTLITEEQANGADINECALWVSNSDVPLETTISNGYSLIMPEIYNNAVLYSGTDLMLNGSSGISISTEIQQPQTYSYYEKTFTINNSESYTLTEISNGSIIIFIDGNVVLDNSTIGQTSSVSLNLTNGTHYLTCQVFNDGPDMSTEQTALNVILFDSNNNVVFQSNQSWLCSQTPFSLQVTSLQNTNIINPNFTNIINPFLLENNNISYYENGYCDAGQITYYETNFTLTTQTELNIAFSAKDGASLYIDGNLILSYVDQYLGGNNSTELTTTINLPIGIHIIDVTTVAGFIPNTQSSSYFSLTISDNNNNIYITTSNSTLTTETSANTNNIYSNYTNWCSASGSIDTNIVNANYTNLQNDLTYKPFCNSGILTNCNQCIIPNANLTPSNLNIQDFVMFSKYTFPTIRKGADLSLLISWYIYS